MQQNDDNNNNFEGKTNRPNKKKVKDMEYWRNEHGQPSYDYLRSLVSSGNLESLEKLKSIATDLDVKFDPNISVKILAELTYSSARGDDPQTTP